MRGGISHHQLSKEIGLDPKNLRSYRSMPFLSKLTRFIYIQARALLFIIRHMCPRLDSIKPALHHIGALVFNLSNAITSRSQKSDSFKFVPHPIDEVTEKILKPRS